jgi:hypothetical protein
VLDVAARFCDHGPAMANPFEPPRSDLEGVAAAGDAGTVPEPALRDLVATAPWARWTVRFALASLVLSLINAVVTMVKAKNAVVAGSQIGSLVVGLPVSILFLVFFQRYAARAAELAAGEGRALPDVIDAQRSLYKLFGIVTIILFVVMALFMVVAIVVGVMAAGRAGR